MPDILTVSAERRMWSLSEEIKLSNDYSQYIQVTYLILAAINRSLNRKRCRSCLCRPLWSSTGPSISRVLLEHMNDDRNAHVSMLAEGLSLKQTTCNEPVSQMLNHKTKVSVVMTDSCLWNMEPIKVTASCLHWSHRCFCTQQFLTASLWKYLKIEIPL